MSEMNSDFPGSKLSGGSDACEDAKGEEENNCEGLDDGGDEAISSAIAFVGEKELSASSDTFSCEI